MTRSQLIDAAYKRGRTAIAYGADMQSSAEVAFTDASGLLMQAAAKCRESDPLKQSLLQAAGEALACALKARDVWRARA